MDDASAWSLVPSWSLLPSSTSPAATSDHLDHLDPPRALMTEQQRARKLIAHMEDRSGEQGTSESASASLLVFCYAFPPSST